MADWKTFVGFFQKGEYEEQTQNGDTKLKHYCNFFPVMEKRGIGLRRIFQTEILIMEDWS